MQYCILDNIEDCVADILQNKVKISVGLCIISYETYDIDIVNTRCSNIFIGIDCRADTLLTE